VIDAATHGMTSQKESLYDHLFRSPSSPFFLFLGAHLRVASTHYINPVSDELVYLGLLFYYLIIVLFYYVIIYICAEK